VNVTALVTGAGTYNFVMATTSNTATSFSSKEGANPPQLVVVIDGGVCTVSGAAAGEGITIQQACTGTGLKAELYANPNLTPPLFGQTTSPVQVNFDWGTGVPFNAAGFPSDNFSIRFSGQVEAIQTGAYQFATNADDGAVLWLYVGGVWQKLIDRWNGPAGIHPSPSVNLVQGGKYDIVVDYVDRTGMASVQLAWNGPGVGAPQGTYNVIPLVNLYPDLTVAPPAIPPTPTPTPSPTPTATPTPTEPSLGTWYVVCQIPGNLDGVKARNFPTGDGQEILRYGPGTALSEFERRQDADGIEWIRVTGYESYNGETLWVAIAAGGATNLTPTAPQGGCPPVTPLPTYIPQPTATITYQGASINCPTVNWCPHEVIYNGNPNTPNVAVLAFVLACEADNDPLDAVNIAWVFKNRTRSGAFRGSIWDVMRQSGQWDCFLYGARTNTILGNSQSVPQQITDLATLLLNGSPIAQPSDIRIRWYGLYTYGTGPFAPPANENLLPADLINGVYNNIVSAGQCPYPQATLNTIYIARSPFSGRSFTTVFFTDSPIQNTSPCP
jgi:PA14 domain